MIAALAIALFLHTPVDADPWDYDAFDPPVEAFATPDLLGSIDCMEGADGSIAAMRQCRENDIERLEQTAEQELRNAATRLENHDAERLADTQRHWEEGRRPVCRRKIIEHDAADGSYGPIALADCLIGDLRRRILWLRALGN